MPLFPTYRRGLAFKFSICYATARWRCRVFHGKRRNTPPRSKNRLWFASATYCSATCTIEGQSLALAEAWAPASGAMKLGLVVRWTAAETRSGFRHRVTDATERRQAVAHRQQSQRLNGWALWVDEQSAWQVAAAHALEELRRWIDHHHVRLTGKAGFVGF